MEEQGSDQGIRFPKITKEQRLGLYLWSGLICISIGLGFIHISLPFIFLGTWFTAVTLFVIHEKQKEKEEKGDN